MNVTVADSVSENEQKSQENKTNFLSNFPVSFIRFQVVSAIKCTYADTHNLNT